MNGGLCGAIIALNTVFVLIAAYCMFNERINKTKLLAMIFLIVAVILVGLFRPDGLEIDMPEVSGTGVSDQFSKDLSKF